MSDEGLHISWLVIAPMCLLTDILAVTVICHFRSQLHGSDVTILSLIISMAANASLIVPLPAILGVIGQVWTITLCKFYVWAFLTFRMVQLQNVVILTFQWMSILKTSSQKTESTSTFYVKMSVPLTWVASGIVGLLPVIGEFPKNYSNGGDCNFLPFDISTGFAVFIIIFSLACIAFTFFFAIDSVCILRYVKEVAVTKYGVSRFYFPKKDLEVAGGYTIHERYSQLNFACDMCHLVIAFIIASFCINHIPFTVS